jgi:hypothetical protein
MSSVTDGAWLTCDYCPADDNEWPISAFTYAGNAFNERRSKMCNSCWGERYERISAPCTLCGRAMNSWRKRTRAGEPVQHRPGTKACLPRVQPEPGWAGWHQRAPA